MAGPPTPTVASRDDPDWRTQHCADLAAEWLKRATGRDVWGELGGPPRSPKEAAAIYRRLRVRTLKNAVSKVLGKPVDPKRAMRGDIALVESGEIRALGIVRGDLVECFDRMQPIERVTCCWRVSPPHTDKLNSGPGDPRQI